MKRGKLGEVDPAAKWRVMQREPFKGQFIRAKQGCPFCGKYPGTCDPFNCQADSAPPVALQAKGAKYDLQNQTYHEIKRLYGEFMASQ